MALARSGGNKNEAEGGRRDCEEVEKGREEKVGGNEMDEEEELGEGRRRKTEEKVR